MVAKGDLLGFWPVLGRGHVEKFWARVKNRKPQFPGAKGTFEEKICPPQKKFSQKLRNFFTSCPFADRTPPRGRKLQNAGFLRPFGLEQPLALREIPGENRNTHTHTHIQGDGL